MRKMQGYYVLQDGTRLEQEIVFKEAMRHLSFIDRLDRRKVCLAYEEAFLILKGDLKEQPGHWRF